jgi:hypothetical protein
MYAAGGNCYKKHSNRQISSYTPSVEEVLFHELIHAVRFVSNTLKLDYASTKGLTLYENKEEFIAVVVTNIYQSEVKGNLRAGHRRFLNLDDQLKDSFEFYKASSLTYTYMEYFCKTNPHFTKRLCRLKVPFNPVHAFYHDKKKCQDFANSKEALARDSGPFGVFSTLSPWLSWDVWKDMLKD